MPVEEISQELARVYIREARGVWEETKGKSNADWTLLASAEIGNSYGMLYPLFILKQTTEDDPLVQWILRYKTGNGAEITVGGGIFQIDSNADKTYAREKAAAIMQGHRKEGLYQNIIMVVRRTLGFPIHSDFMRSHGCDLAWRRLKEKGEPIESKGMTWKYNPPIKTFRVIIAGPDGKLYPNKLIDARNLTEAKQDAKDLLLRLPKGWSIAEVKLAFQINPKRRRRK